MSRAGKTNHLHHPRHQIKISQRKLEHGGETRNQNTSRFFRKILHKNRAKGILTIFGQSLSCAGVKYRKEEESESLVDSRMHNAHSLKDFQ